MTKIKRRNPAYEAGVNSKAWILAGKCIRENICHTVMIELANEQSKDFDNLAYDTECARRELGYRSDNRNQKLRRKVAERLPIRSELKNLPFYLRPSYQLESGFDMGKTYIPRRKYQDCINDYAYQPILDMEAELHNKRYHIIRNKLDGLIRWTETINTEMCEFIVLPSFKGFHFKINADTLDNKLPVIKRYNSMSISVKAPKAFFYQSFWGLGEHLVVQVLDTYVNEDEVTILKTLSCDRDNLYALESPTILKERYYVQKGSMKGTGLTEQAAIKSLQYYMGKAVSFALGV